VLALPKKGSHVPVRTNKEANMTQERMIRIKEVMRITGLSRSTIYAMIAENVFPKQKRIGKRAIAFLHSEIAEWVRTRGGLCNG
jgi:prophage regulatory protein